MTENTDTFFEDKKRKIDYVLVHENDEDSEEKKAIRRNFEQFIKEEGLQLENFKTKTESCFWRKIKNCTTDEVQLRMILFSFIKKYFIIFVLWSLNVHDLMLEYQLPVHDK